MNCTYCTHPYHIWTDCNQPQPANVIGRLPLLLQCGHSYCQTCIHDLASVMVYVRCHKCSVTTRFEESGTSLLPFDLTTIGKLFIAGEGSSRPHETGVALPSERRRSRVRQQPETKEEEEGPSVPVVEDGPDLVRVVEVTSPDEVIVERMSSGERLREIVRKCSEQAARCPSFSLREWMFLKPGNRCLSKKTKDEQWYRCEVVESRLKLPPVDASNVRKIRVRYLDVGRREWASFSLTRQMPSSLDDLEPLCENCSLNVLPSSDSKTWGHAETSALSQLLNPNRRFRLIDLNVADASKRCVDLRPVRAAGGLSVRRWCAMSGLARLPDDADGLDEEETAAMADLGRVSPTVAASMLLFLDEKGDAAVQAYRRSTTVELPDESLVKVACLDSLPSIWVTPHPYGEMMAFERNDPVLTGVDEMFCPRVGGLYAAEYSDGLWYRCLVEAVEQKQARVLSVDFGNHWCVDWESAIARLSKAYQEKPFLAHRVRLAGIEFPQSVQEERVHQLLQSSPVYLLRYHCNVVGRSREDVAVYLLHRTSCANLSLADAGLATVTAESAQLMRDLRARTNAQVKQQVTDRASGTLGSASLPAPPVSFITAASAKASRHCRGRYKVDYAVGDAPPVTQAALLSTDHRLGLLAAGDAERLAQMPVCSIAAAESPDVVYVRMETTTWQRHRQRLAAALNQLHTSHRHPSTRLQSAAAARCGSLCAVVRPVQLDWCRGLILRVVDADTVEVFLIDLGEKLHVPLTYVVQPLDECLVTRWPLLAARCRVLGVAPAGGESGVWSSVSKDTMAELVRVGGSQVFLSRVSWSDGMPGVDLILPDVELRWRLCRREEGEEEEEEEVENRRLISLRQKLVDCGVARPCPFVLDSGESPSLKPQPVCLEALRYQLGLADGHCATSCPVCSCDDGGGSCSPSSSSTGGSGRQSPAIKSAQPHAKWPQQRVIQFVGRSGLSVVVTRLDDDLTVACILATAGLRARVKRLEEAASRQCAAGSVAPRLSAREWHVGEACLVECTYEVTTRWRRGQVLSVMHESDSARVYLIDHAQSFVFGNQFLRPVDRSNVSQRSLFVPPIAWRCRVAAANRDAVAPGPRLEKAREILTSGAECRIQVLEAEIAKDGVPTLVCKLWCPELCDEDVGRYLHVEDSLESAYLPCVPAPEGVVWRVEATAALAADEVFLQHVISQEEAEEKAVEFPHLKEWLSIARRQWEMISNSEFHFEIQKSVGQGEVAVGPGALCSAVFSVDQLWYRAQLRREVGAGRWEVVFVDFGNTEVVDVAQLALAVRQDLPVCCCLYRWAGVQRAPRVASGQLFCAELSAGLAEAQTLYMRRQASRIDGQLPVMQLFLDKECTVSALDLVPSLLTRKSED